MQSVIQSGTSVIWASVSFTSRQFDPSVAAAFREWQTGCHFENVDLFSFQEVCWNVETSGSNWFSRTSKFRNRKRMKRQVWFAAPYKIPGMQDNSTLWRVLFLRSIHTYICIYSTHKFRTNRDSIARPILSTDTDNMLSQHVFRRICSREAASLNLFVYLCTCSYEHIKFSHFLLPQQSLAFLSWHFLLLISLHILIMSAISSYSSANLFLSLVWKPQKMTDKT